MRPLVLVLLVLAGPVFGAITPPKAGDGNRELATKLLDAVEAGTDEATQLRVLGWLDTQRDSNNFLWNWDERPMVDRNAVEFLTQTLSTAWLEAKDRVSTATADRWRAFLKLNLAGVRAHRVSVEYTNIFLMKAANLVALGRGLDDPTAIREGGELLAQWDKVTTDHGIAEFLSPTYTAVDLTDLGLFLHWAPDELKPLAQRCLDRVWTTVLRHWMDPSARLGGAHSRDYDRLTGHGALDAWVAHLRNPAVAPGGALDRLAFAGPSKPVAPLAAGETEKLRWGTDDWSIWYRGSTWGLGSATKNYHDMDKTLLVADLGGGPDQPVVSMLMEGRGDYYGTSPVLEAGSGHLKSLHLMPRQSTTQDGPRVLTAAAADTSATGRVETTLVLPARAVYRLNGVELHPTGGRSLWKVDPIPTDATTSVTVEPSGALSVVDNDPHRGVGESALVPAVAGHRYRTTVTGSGRALMVYHNYLGEGRSLVDKERAAPLKAGDQQTTVFETQAPEGTAWIRLWLYSTTAQTGGYRVTSAVTEDVSDPAHPVEINRWDGEPPVPFDAEVPTGSVLTVTAGSVTLALRPLVVTDTAGKPVSFHLINDGADRGAYRLTAAQTAPGPSQAVTVLWAEAAGTPSAADVEAMVRQTAARDLTTEARAQASLVATKR